MVEHQGQHVLAVAQPQQFHAHRRVAFQVERTAHQAGERGVEVGDVPHRQVDLAGREDVLVRNAVVLREPRPQRLVPGDHIGQRRPQRLDVDLAFEAHDQRDVVGGRRPFEVVQEPQPLLRAGQRHQLRPVHRDQRRARGPGAGGEQRGQARGGRRLEHRPDFELGVQGACGCGRSAGWPAANGRRGRRSCRPGRPAAGRGRRRTARTAAVRRGCAARGRTSARPGPVTGARGGRACRWRSPGARRGPRSPRAPCARAAGRRPGPAGPRSGC